MTTSRGATRQPGAPPSASTSRTARPPSSTGRTQLPSSTTALAAAGLHLSGGDGLFLWMESIRGLYGARGGPRPGRGGPAGAPRAPMAGQVDAEQNRWVQDLTELDADS